MQAPPPAAQWCPPVADIDVLELIRSGALGDGAELGPGGAARLVLAEAAPDGGPDGEIEIVDPEGVPLARARTARPGGPAAPLEVTEVTSWLRHRSPRPFERLHLTPSDLPGPAPVLLVDASSDVAQVASAAAAEPGLRVLLLGSVAADRAGVITRAVRRLQGALADLDATLAVVPADPDAPEQVAAVGAAYGRGAQVRTAWGDGEPESPPRGVVVLLTGLSGSGKSTIARAVRDHVLETSDRSVSLLDGDEVRRHLSAGLTFSREDRETNIRRIGWVAAEIAYHGGLAICSPIAPFEQTRADVRRFVGERGARFLLVHVATPLAECERRDRKGLYERARAGLIPDFTGISSPYEEPTDADLVIDTTSITIEQARDRVLALLAEAVPQ